MAGKLCDLLQLCAQLAAAVAAVLEEPSCEHSRDVQDLVSHSGLSLTGSLLASAAYFLVSCSPVRSSSIGRCSRNSACG
jgi:hypothetical protein